MTTGTVVPTDLQQTVEAHGQAVAAADNGTVLADFLPDRLGQLIASADVPTTLKAAEVRHITPLPDGGYDAVIRYTDADDTWFELRSRWVRYVDGTWRVFSVRNIPDTPPWLDLTGPAEDGIDEPHWAGLRAGRFLIQRCGGCLHWIWAPLPSCPSCHGFDMVWEPVDLVGTIYSWTRTWQPFSPESRGHLPYVNVLVELPTADNRRVVGVLAAADGITPRIGQTVRGRIEQPPDDRYWPLVRWYLDETRSNDE